MHARSIVGVRIAPGFTIGRGNSAAQGNVSRKHLLPSEQPKVTPKEVAMTVEMHLSGVPEAIFLRERDATVFLENYKEWLKDQSEVRIFEFYHNGSVHCFSLTYVVYVKIKMPTDSLTRELAEAGAIFSDRGASARH